MSPATSPARFPALAALTSALAAALLLCPPAAAIIINVPGGQPTIQAGVNAANINDEVVIANGVYTGAGNRNINLLGKQITVRSASDNPAACVIDCQNAGRGFILQSGETQNTRIRGLTIRNGVAPGGAPPNDRAGGIVTVNSSVTVENCVIESCDAAAGGGGGGFFNFGGAPIIIGCRFVGNTAPNFGGAIEVFSSNTTIRDCVFLNNVASVGGGIEFGQSTTASVTNSLFVGNMAQGARFGFPAYGGGGVVCYNGANVTIRNSAFVNNSTNHIAAIDGGGGLFTSNSPVNVANTIFWGNTDLMGPAEASQLKRQGTGTIVLNYSDVQGLTGALGGAGNIGADPMFANPGAGNYRLGVGSPAIDAGSNAFVPAGVITDLDNAPRFVDAFNYPDSGAGIAPIVDIGPYEAAAGTPSPCPGDLDGDGQVGAADLALLLGAWNGGPGPADLDNSGTVGSGDLAILLGAWGPCP